MSNAFTEADLDGASRPGENPYIAMIRGIFASIDVCLAESGCPLSYDQRAVLHKAIASNSS